MVLPCACCKHAAAILISGNNFSQIFTTRYCEIAVDKKLIMPRLYFSLVYSICSARFCSYTSHIHFTPSPADIYVINPVAELAKLFYLCLWCRLVISLVSASHRCEIYCFSVSCTSNLNPPDPLGFFRSATWSWSRRLHRGSSSSHEVADTLAKSPSPPCRRNLGGSVMVES